MIKNEMNIEKRVYKLNEINPLIDKPFIFFLSNKKDRKGVFPNYILFTQNSTILIRSFIEENKELDFLSQIPPIGSNDFRQPHSAIMINDEKYIIFNYSTDDNTFFFFLDLKKNKQYLVDIQIFEKTIKSQKKIIGFGTTFFKTNDKRSFIVNCKSYEKKHRKYYLEYYKCSFDLKNCELIYYEEITKDTICPHSTRQIRNLIISSEFNETIFSYKNRTYEDFYEMKMNILEDFAKQELRIGKISDVKEIELEFLKHWKEEDFIFACKKSLNYYFSLANGYIRIYDMKENKSKKFYINHSKPAHFEVDEESNIYLSCHNFFIDCEGRNYYDNTAAIIKLKIDENRVKIEKEFNNPTGFRFTSHQVMLTPTGEYLYTIGHPNRLFVIDSLTMELIKFVDLGGKLLDENYEPTKYLVENDFKRMYITAFCVIDKGRKIICQKGESLELYCIETGELITQIKILDLFSLSGNYEDFFNESCFHAQCFSS